MDRNKLGVVAVRPFVQFVGRLECFRSAQIKSFVLASANSTVCHLVVFASAVVVVVVVVLPEKTKTLLINRATTQWQLITLEPKKRNYLVY